jgi:pimeloyl-[acyl-carrier protein] methyl ester esterase
LYTRLATTARTALGVTRFVRGGLRGAALRGQHTRDDVQVDGGALRRHVLGPAPSATSGGRDVVLLHGFGGDHRQLLGLAAALVAAGHRAHLLDARGHGGSVGFGRRPAIRAMAMDLRVVLDTVPAGAVVIGVSMGAQTIFELAARGLAADGHVAGRRGLAGVGGLVLVDQSPRPRPGPDWPHGIFGRVRARDLVAFERALAGDPRAIGRIWLRALLGTDETTLMKLLMAPSLGRGLPEVSPETLLLAADIMRADWRPIVPALGELPVLLVYGGRSFYPGAGRWMAEQLPGATLAWLDDAGHALIAQAPRRVERAVLGFLGGALSGGAAVAASGDDGRADD